MRGYIQKPGYILLILYVDTVAAETTKLTWCVIFHSAYNKTFIIYVVKIWHQKRDAKIDVLLYYYSPRH